MLEFKTKNWAGFYESMKSQHEELSAALRASHEPYLQWEIQEKQKLLNKIMNLYIDYLQKIGSDNGLKFIKVLEQVIVDLTNKPKNEIYKSQINLATKLFKEFKKFREE